MDAKTCTKCGEHKPMADYYKRDAECKVCRRARAKAYRDANLDAVRAQDRERSKRRDHKPAQRKYRDANRDKINAKSRAARAADPEAARAKDAAYYRRNPESFAAASRRWKAANPDKLRQYDEQRRARRAGATLGPVDFRALYAAHPDCYLCGLPLTGETHMDHVIPLVKGGAHSMDNLRPTHATCNLSKGNRLLSELPWYSGPTDLGSVA